MATFQDDKGDILSQLKSPETPLFEKYEVIDDVLRSGKLEDVNKILEVGAAVNDVNVKTQATVWCVKERKLDLLKLVISKGVDVNRRNLNDETALICALTNNDKDCISQILAAGADVNMLSKLTSLTVHRDEKRKIMRIFVLSDNVKHVDRIINADVNDIDVKNEVLYISALEGKDDLIKYLIQKGANVNLSAPKLIAFQYEKLHYPRFHVYESDSVNSYEYTPLTVAVQHDRVKCVATLLQAGANFIPILKDLKIPPDQKSKIIQSIVRSGSMEHVDMVLGLGADVKGLVVANESVIGAAKEGNLELMKYLISKGASVNAKGVKHGWVDLGITVLQTAIQFEHYNCVNFLLQAGVAIDTANTVESLVKSGNLQYVKNLLTASKLAESDGKKAANKEMEAKEDTRIDDDDDELLIVDVNCVSGMNDINVITATLLGAAKQGNMEVIKYLVNNEGADVNATRIAPKMRQSAPAWILAVDNHHTECAEFLIKSGSEIREKLMSLKTSESDRRHIVQALCQLGNVEYMSMVTDAATMDTVVKNHALYWAVMTDNIELLTALLGKEADVNEFIYGELLLSVASREGKLRSIDVLLQKGAALNKGSRRQETPLMFAVRGSHVECVNRLIKAGADVKETYWVLMTEAINDKNIPCLQPLLDAGVDVNKTDCQEKTILMCAANEGNHKAVDALITAGADVNRISCGALSAMLEAASKGCARSLCSLIKAGAELNRTHNLGSRALLSAAKQNVECVDLLLRAGVDVNTTVERSDDYYDRTDGSTALPIASEDGKNGIVELLLRKGADVNKPNNYGYTALMKAVENCHVQTVESLIGAGADVNVKERYGELTPIFTASSKGSPECVSLLIKNGADVNKCLEDLNTPLYVATEKGHDQCVKLLIQAGADVNTTGSDGSTALIKAALLEDERCLDVLLKGGADVNRADNKKNTALILAANQGNGRSVRLFRVATFELVQNSLTFPRQFPDISPFFPDNLSYFSKLETRIVH